MKIKQVFILMAAAIVMSTACNQTDFKGFEKTDSGLHYKFHETNADSLQAQLGDVLIGQIVIRQGDSVMYEGQPDQRFAIVDTVRYITDLNEGLAMLRKGDSATFIQYGDTLRKHMNMPADSGSIMYYDIRVSDIFTKAEYDLELMQAENDRLAELDELKTREEEDFAKYIKENNVKVQPNEDGIYVIKKKAGFGRKVKEKDIITFDVEGNLINMVPFLSSKEYGEPFVYQVGSKRFYVKWENALMSMRKGGSYRLLIPSSAALGDAGSEDGKIPPFAPLLMDINVKEVQSEEDFTAEQKKKEEKMVGQEQKDLQSYLQSNGIGVQASPSGIYLIELVKGTGAKPSDGQKVSVHYTGTFLDGKKFDASFDRGRPFEFTLNRNEVIKGWDEVVAQMNVGSKVKAIIPSSMAYGPQGSGPIKPFTPLVFEMELLEIKE